MRWRYFVSAFVLFTGLMNVAWATQLKDDEDSFKVVSFALHADAPKAEICLVLSAPVDMKDRGYIASLVQLRKDGKKQKIGAGDLSLTPTDICVQNLEHRHSYKITLQKLYSKGGKELEASFTTSFTVPDRKPILGFVSEGRLSALPRHVRGQNKTVSEKDLLRSGMAHVVHSVNVQTTHLMLYHVTQRDDFAGAWQQFKQINLSPSESLIFARNKGKMVFESDLVFGEEPNHDQMLVAPLPPDEKLSPGLYYLAAMPRGKAEQNPGLFAGQWFLVSDLHLTALQLPDGVQVFAATEGAPSAPQSNVSVSLLSQDGGVLAEGKTDVQGALFAPLSQEKIRQVAFVTGQFETGDVDIVVLGQDRQVQLDDLSFQAFLTLDRKSYVSGETAAVTLHAEDQAGKMLDVGDSVLRVLRSDRRQYKEYPLPKTKDGVYSLPVPLPVLGVSVTWTLSWVRKDGRLLAEAPLVLEALSSDGNRVDSGSGQKNETEFDPALTSRNLDGIEVKSMFDEQTFSENSLAVFSVVAVDEQGRRRAQGGLYYLIYEEGRSFQWFPADGHWDYIPLPNQRRIGGGRLDISANRENVIRWPVTAGHYVLKITNARGDVLTRVAFDAGRAAAHTTKKDDQLLHFAAGRQKLEPSKANTIKLYLAKEAMVNVLVTDGKVRQIIHRLMKAGENIIEVTPEPEWGNQILVRAEASFANTYETIAARRRMGLHKTSSDLTVVSSLPSSLLTGQAVILPIQVQKSPHDRQTYVRAVFSFLPSEPERVLPPVLTAPTKIDEQGRAKFKTILPAFDGKVKITVYAWNDGQFGSFSQKVEAHRPLLIEGTLPDKITVGDNVNFLLTLSNYGASVGSYDYAIKLPEGVKTKEPLKGKIFLGRKTRIFSQHLSVPRFVDGTIGVVLTAPDGKRTERSWPLVARPLKHAAQKMKVEKLEPQKQISISGYQATKEKPPSFALIAPVALPPLIPFLQHLVWQEPRSTEDIALWLETTRLWEKVLVGTGMVSGARLYALRTEKRAALQHRQHEDGSFARLRARDSNDILSTALAMNALAGHAPSSVELASEWLTGKLQNTWFDESERTVRAVAFDSLARLKKVDIAALRYFSQTSQDKDLEPLTPAILGVVLGRVGDEDLAVRWHEQAKQKLEKKQLLPMLFWLAQSGKSNTDDLTAQLKKLDLASIQSNDHESMLLLAAWAYTAERAGTWRVIIRGKEEKYFGSTALPLKVASSANQKVDIKNVSDKPLYLFEVAR